MVGASACAKQSIEADADEKVDEVDVDVEMKDVDGPAAALNDSTPTESAATSDVEAKEDIAARSGADTPRIAALSDVQLATRLNGVSASERARLLLYTARALLERRTGDACSSVSVKK